MEGPAKLTPDLARDLLYASFNCLLMSDLESGKQNLYFRLNSHSELLVIGLHCRVLSFVIISTATVVQIIETALIQGTQVPNLDRNLT